MAMPMENGRADLLTGLDLRGSFKKEAPVTGSAARVSRETQTLKREVVAMAIMEQIGSYSLARTSKPQLNANPDAMAQTLSRGTVRVARVWALRRLIAAGTYRVSSSDLAAKLLQVMQEQRSGQGRWMQT